MNKSLFYFCLLFCITSTAYSYDWTKCRRAWISQPGSSLVAATTMSPIQFMSSWGACSAKGKTEDSLQEFYNDNYWLIKRDFAKNDGEFKDAFLIFFKCNKQGDEFVVTKIRENYETIFEPNYTGRAVVLSEESIENSYNRMIQIILSDKNTNNNCDMSILKK